MIKRKHILIAAAAMALASCSNDTEPGGESNTPVAARFTASIGEVQSRVSGTDWEPGDTIGIYAMNAAGESVYSNKLYVTTGGDGNFTHLGGEASGIIFKDTEPLTIEAFYPALSRNENAPFGISIDTRDQSRPKELDLLKASTVARVMSSTVNLLFGHQMARLVLNVKAGDGISPEMLKTGKYSLDNVLATMSGNTEGGMSFGTGDIDVCTAPRSDIDNGISYGLILVPGAFDGGSSFRVEVEGITYKLNLDKDRMPLSQGTTNTLNVTVGALGVTFDGCTIAPWTGTDREGEATVVPTIGYKPVSKIETGDFYFSDGTFADKGDELTAEQKAACIGIVLKKRP